MNLLLSIYVIQKAKRKKVFYLLSGIFVGFMMFSSPTSTVFLPYYFLALSVDLRFFSLKTQLREIFIRFSLVIMGTLIIFCYFTFPNSIGYIQSFIDFLAYSQKGNDFIVWRKDLVQYFPIPDGFRGGGWPWILKYFLTFMPIIFCAYIVSLIYLLKRSFKQRWIIFVILISLSTPISVEIVKVAQLGRNYFSWLPGMILGICCALFLFQQTFLSLESKQQKWIKTICLLLFAGHVFFNGYLLISDAFPSRMAKTRIYDWLQDNHVQRVFTYREHPRNLTFVRFIKNPKQSEALRVTGISSIAQVPTGYILIPPITGKTIWNSCRDEDYQNDPVLSALYQSGEMKKYVVASFKTLASSRIWSQEQEVCSYRDLILGQISQEDRMKGRAWILDAEKIRREWKPIIKNLTESKVELLIFKLMKE